MKDGDKTEGDSSVVRLLAERAKLEEKIRKNFTQELVVFFCDIKGYTSYTETHGDLAGRALAQRVNEIAFPSLKQHNGQLVKTIGDAIMAYFENPLQSVLFALDVQKKVRESNKEHPPTEEVHLRMGLHFGKVILDEGDIYGDAVNIAARIEPQAKPGGVLISPDLRNALEGNTEIEIRYAKKVTMKGKSEALDLYEVIEKGGTFHDYIDDSESRKRDKPEQLPSAEPGLSKKWFAIAFIVVIVAVGIKSMNLLPWTSNVPFDPYISGYSALRINAFEQAQSFFNKLSSNDPRLLESKVAINARKHNFETADLLLEEALEKGGDLVYVNVLDGDRRLRSNKQEQALRAYQKATELEKGLDWHRAQAYNGMGRILAAKNLNDQALSSYAKATQLAPDESDILTNYGVLLERLGKTEEALNTFQLALKANPDDALAQKRLVLAERREKAKQNKEKQERVDSLVEQLVTQFKNGAESPPDSYPVPNEGMNLPLSIWLMNFSEKGDIPVRNGESDILTDMIGQELQGTGNIELVDRELLDSLLAELKLGSSELADRDTALKLGRILAAKIIITGSLYRQGPQTLISLKIIETETSRIRAGVTYEVKNGSSLFQSSSKIAEEIMAKLKRSYSQLFTETGKVDPLTVWVDMDYLAPIKLQRRGISIDFASVKNDGRSPTL